MADSVSGTDSTSGLTYVKSDTSSSNGGMTVNTEMFLKLLVAQMQYQDPMEPQSNADFIAQLAQMSSLEEIKSMGGSMDTTKAMGYIGKEVYATVLNSESGVTEVYDGVVSGVTMKNGEAYVIVGNYAVSVDDISAVAEVESNPKTDSKNGATVDEEKDQTQSA